VKQYVSLRLFKTFKKVAFYTFVIEDQDDSETDKFFNKVEPMTQLEAEVNALVSWIIEIGENRGAIYDFFRFEEEASALPPKAKFATQTLPVGNLRLYCVWLSEAVVVLANGGLKTAQTVQECPDLWPHFTFAKKMAKQLTNLLSTGELVINGKEIENINETELTF
jgi:hypothetical protein